MDKRSRYMMYFLTACLVISSITFYGGGLIKRATAAEAEVVSVSVEMNKQFEQVKHLIGANTSQQVIYLKILVLKPDINTEVAKKISISIHKQAKALKKSPDLFLALIKTESEFNPNALSGMKAQGLMQVMPCWKKTICQDYDLNDIDQNIRCGTQVYSFYEEQYGNMRMALTVYNRGPSAVDLALSQNKNPNNGYADKVLSIFSKLQGINEQQVDESL